jgi:hypothetical protein
MLIGGTLKCSHLKRVLDAAETDQAGEDYSDVGADCDTLRELVEAALDGKPPVLNACDVPCAEFCRAQSLCCELNLPWRQHSEACTDARNEHVAFWDPEQWTPIGHALRLRPERRADADFHRDRPSNHAWNIARPMERIYKFMPAAMRHSPWGDFSAVSARRFLLLRNPVSKEVRHGLDR